MERIDVRTLRLCRELADLEQVIRNCGCNPQRYYKRLELIQGISCG